jgi:hypothetical protein
MWLQEQQQRAGVMVVRKRTRKKKSLCSSHASAGCPPQPWRTVLGIRHQQPHWLLVRQQRAAVPLLLLLLRLGILLCRRRCWLAGRVLSRPRKQDITLLLCRCSSSSTPALQLNNHCLQQHGGQQQQQEVAILAALIGLVLPAGVALPMAQAGL